MLIPLLAKNQWTPKRITGIGPSLVPRIQRANGQLFQNIGKTVQATADGEPVRVATCPYTGIDIVAPSDAASPLLKTDGAGKWWMLFDGSDDYMTATVASAYMSSNFTLAAAFRSATADRMMIGGGQEVNGKRRNMWMKVGSLFSFNGQNADLTGTQTISTSVDYRGIIVGAPNPESVDIYVNNAAKGTGFIALVAHTGTSVRYGANLGGTEVWGGRFYAASVVNARVTTAERALLDTYLASFIP